MYYQLHVFLIKKTHACRRNKFLEDSAVLTVCEIRRSSTWLKEIIPMEHRKEIGAWRVERKACEKPGFPMSICKDCTESWIVES